MKTTFICLFAIMSVIYGCSKDSLKSKVEKFINEVKADKYTEEFLPDLSPDAIPYLLESANNFEVITHFPINPISSYGPNRLTIGECLLWTIEAIRLTYINGTSGLGFPSWVPELGVRNNPNIGYLTDSELNIVYDLYYHWWYDNTDKDFEEIRLINPLGNSQYIWQ